MAKKDPLIPVERIERAILMIRGQKVMLDADLSRLYDVPTKALNQAVGRNERRFPPDFMFRLTKEEKNELVTNCDRFKILKHSSAIPRFNNPVNLKRLFTMIDQEEWSAMDVDVKGAAFEGLLEKSAGDRVPSNRPSD